MNYMQLCPHCQGVVGTLSVWIIHQYIYYLKHNLGFYSISLSLSIFLVVKFLKREQQKNLRCDEQAFIEK